MQLISCGEKEEGETYMDKDDANSIKNSTNFTLGTDQKKTGIITSTESMCKDIHRRLESIYFVVDNFMNVNILGNLARCLG